MLSVSSFTQWMNPRSINAGIREEEQEEKGKEGGGGEGRRRDKRKRMRKVMK